MNAGPTFYCWHCYADTDQSTGPCRQCGHPVEGPGGLEYTDRLLWALHHPLPERRIVAAQMLGVRRDEGGFAPDLAAPEEVLEVIVSAITDAGYSPGLDGVGIALDPAASEFRQDDGSYLVNSAKLSSDDMIERYAAMVDAFPIWSIEDGLGEGDHDGWQRLTSRLGERVQLVGDDNFCTNPAIISDGIANAALIKLDQIGSVTETLDAMAVCHRAGYAQMVSHRSGETLTRSSLTWPSAPAADRSRPVPPRGESGWRSTTGCWRSPPATPTWPMVSPPVGARSL